MVALTGKARERRVGARRLSPQRGRRAPVA